MQGIEIPIGAPLGQLDKDLNGAQKKLKQFSQTADKDVNNFSKSANSAFNSIALSLTGALSVGAFVSFGKEVLSVTAEFEKLGAVLGNTLGSKGLANLKLKEIEEFAAKTPFSVNELTAAYVKLANQGFKPTGDEMRRLGDLAASTGKSFDQLAEAILDAQTGEFERLKEFGIISQQSGDKVIFTFKGVQTTVDKSNESIRNYITSLGDLEGVSGATAVISETLTGKISNLGDAWDKMLVSVGNNTSGIFSGAIDIISEAINSIGEFNKELATASKFNIKGNAFESLVKYTKIALNVPGANVGFATTQDLVVQAIQRTEKKVNDLVSGSLSAAKSTDDFGKSISKLKLEGDKLIKGTANLDLKSAYKKIYEDAIKALQDGRNNFAKEASKPIAANFGTAKKPKEDNTAKEAKKKSDDLLKESKAFSERMRLSLQDFQINAAVEADRAKAKIDFIDPDDLQRAVALSDMFQQEIFGNFQQINQDLINFNQQASDIINNSLVSTFAGIGDAIGTALANGTSVANALGGTLLSSIGAVLSQLGQLAIQTGVTMLAIKVSLKSFNPAIAIGAGVALLALAGYVKAKSSKIGSGGGGGGVGGNFSAPTPQSSSAISTSATGSSQDFRGGTVVFEISGTNLIGVLNRAGAKLTRFGG